MNEREVFEESEHVERRPPQLRCIRGGKTDARECMRNVRQNKPDLIAWLVRQKTQIVMGTLGAIALGILLAGIDHIVFREEKSNESYSFKPEQNCNCEKERNSEPVNTSIAWDSLMCSENNESIIRLLRSHPAIFERSNLK